MIEFLESAALLLALLNPFLVIIYLIDVVQKLEKKQFNRVLIRAGLIATVVFWCFALLGDALFSKLISADFASFQIFGVIIFLLIGLQFVFRGISAIEMLRGESEHIVGAIAMPVLIGPGTISASVIVGEKHDPLFACSVVFAAVFTSILLMILLKNLHDFVRPRREPLIDRYIEITGRVIPVYVGTISVKMIMRGIQTWLKRF
jgi:small neutral amino acid transporter SnatA (MarC family)